MSTASAMLKVAVEAPMPIPRVAIATRLKVGRFAAVRNARASSRLISRSDRTTSD
jgi:hypothetical protein